MISSMTISSPSWRVSRWLDGTHQRHLLTQRRYGHALSSLKQGFGPMKAKRRHYVRSSNERSKVYEDPPHVINVYFYRLGSILVLVKRCDWYVRSNSAWNAKSGVASKVDPLDVEPRDYLMIYTDNSETTKRQPKYRG